MKTCELEDCESEYRAKGYCMTHYNRYHRYGDPYITKYGKTNVGYDTAHSRIYSKRGRAPDYTCQCGSQAQDWAYNHNGEIELTEQREIYGRIYTVTYSPNPDDYIAMCKPCHRKFDSNQ